MTSALPIPMNDDHGDQFPAAVPATTKPAVGRAEGAGDRLVRMNAAYTAKINAAVQADRENLAYELAERTFAEELADADTVADRAPRRPAAHRSRGHRPPTALGRMGTLTRSLRRFDRYTLDVFNPRPPHALYAPPSDHSA